MRAWYLHRTKEGVEYAFKGSHTTDRIKHLLRDTLGYRKAFCGHLSTDIELAYHLATVLSVREPDSIYPALRKSLESMLSLHRSIELFAAGSKVAKLIKLSKLWYHMKKSQKYHLKLLALESLPPYQVFNDNRYEQHSWAWN